MGQMGSDVVQLGLIGSGGVVIPPTRVLRNKATLPVMCAGMRE